MTASIIFPDVLKNDMVFRQVYCVKNSEVFNYAFCANLYADILKTLRKKKLKMKLEVRISVINPASNFIFYKDKEKNDESCGIS